MGGRCRLLAGYAEQLLNGLVFRWVKLGWVVGADLSQMFGRVCSAAAKRVGLQEGFTALTVSGF
jgi:hypothetical protein